MINPIDRQTEVEKYITRYGQHDIYRMGGQRMVDAKMDVSQFEAGRSYLDVGCGHGEMLEFARNRGLAVQGLEVVPELCVGDVVYGYAHNMPIEDKSFDYSTAFDVLEHLLPGDDEMALNEMERVTRERIVVTTNNHPSSNPKNGDNLHINIKTYPEWDKLIRRVFAGHEVMWLKGQRRYVSETWQINLK